MDRDLIAENIALFSNVYLGQRRKFRKEYSLCTVVRIYRTSCTKRIMVEYKYRPYGHYVKRLDAIIDYSSAIYEGFGM